MSIIDDDLDAYVIKKKQSVAELFAPVKDTVESMNVVGWSVVVNYNLRGYEHFETTYPERWVTQYVNKNYNAMDPALYWALTKQGVRRWSEVKLPDILRVMKKAKKYGLVYGGIWSQKTGSKRTVLFVGREDREFFDEEMETIFDEMQPFFSAVGLNSPLTDGEIDVLEQLVEGASTSEIAKALAMTESAVKARVSTARNKLECRTTPQLIYKVMSDGLLQ